MRAYIKLGSVPAADGERVDIMVLSYNANWQYSLRARIKRIAGNKYWGIQVVEGGVVTETYEGAASNPVAGVWYCVELMRNKTLGQQQLWIDNVSRVSTAVAMVYGTNFFSLGIENHNCAASQSYYGDCWIIDSSYIQPELLYEFFEMGGFTWAGLSLGANSSAAVESAHPHHGAGNGIFTAPSGEWAQSFRDIRPDSKDVAYMRAYYKMKAMPASNGERLDLCSIQYLDWDNSLRARLRMVGGEVYWGIQVVEGGAGTQLLEATASNPVADRWYCVELMRNKTLGQQQLWIDGVSKVTGAIALAETAAGFLVGIDGTGCAAEAEVYVDCVLIDDSYIGEEKQAAALKSRHTL